MNARPLTSLVCLSLALGALLGCSVDRRDNPRYKTGDCPPERRYKGFCLDAEGTPDAGGDAATTPDGGSFDGGTGDTGAPTGPVEGDPCVPGTPSEFCYEGPTGTATLGSCKAGERSCVEGVWSACVGQVTPAEEACNALDDDCDGESDEEVTFGSCETGFLGACSAGAERCVNGNTRCEPVTEASPEICDSQDNDCDGDFDEDIEQACYTGEDTGCVKTEDGGFVCKGICKTGTQVCVDGELSTCDGQTTALTEDCTDPGETAADEDCDGVADQTCTCTVGEMQDCYGGPPNTAGVFPCANGQQTCNGTTYGECVGARLPTAESCANDGTDDDCDGVRDDVPGRDRACAVLSNRGICRLGSLDCQDDALVCATPQPGMNAETCDGVDQDCDGQTDEDFNFQQDELNCGGCNSNCTNGQLCCGGHCVDTGSDESNCGQCGRICGNGLTCCSGNCVNLRTNVDNCNVCGMVCPGLLGLVRACSNGVCKLL